MGELFNYVCTGTFTRYRGRGERFTVEETLCFAQNYGNITASLFSGDHKTCGISVVRVDCDIYVADVLGPFLSRFMLMGAKRFDYLYPKVSAKTALVPKLGAHLRET